MAFAPALLAGILVAQNAVNIPVWDGWERGSILQKQEAGTLTFGDLYAPHIEHRMLAPRLVMLALNELSGGDLRAEIAFIFFSVVVTAVCFYFLISKTLPPGRWRYLTALAVNMALFSPMQYQNFLWPIQVAIMLPLTCLALCLAVLRSGLGQWWKFGLCAFFATVGMHSFSHGIMIWPMVFLLVLGGAHYVSGTGRTFFLCGVSVLGMLLLKIYITQEYRVATHHSYGADIGEAVPAVANFEKTFSRPDRIRKYFLASVGNPLARFFSTDSRRSAIEAGRGLLILYIAGLVYLVAVWRNTRIRDALLPWAVAGLFSIGVALLLAIGRSSINLDKAILPRYSSLTLFLPIALIAGGAFVLHRWVGAWREDSQRRVPEGTRVAAAAAVAGIAIAIWWPGWVHGARKMEQWKSARLQARATLLYMKHFEPEKIARIDKGLALAKKYAPFFDAQGWMRPALFPNADFGSFTRVEKALSRSAQRDAVIREASFADGKLSVSGHAKLPGESRTADAVLLTWRAGEGDEWQVLALAEMRGQSMAEMHFLDNHNGAGANLTRPDQYARWGKTVDWDDAPEGGFELLAWALDADRMVAYPLGGGLRLGGSLRSGEAATEDG